MQTLVVYESMYGNTRRVAEAVAAGAEAAGPAAVVHVTDIDPDHLDEVGLLVLGAPTHAWGLPRPTTRETAASKPNPGSPELEPNATGPGVRELLNQLGRLSAPAAAFDTRLNAPSLLTGRASRAIAAHLRRLGAQVIDPPESFLVTRQNQLLAGELERARGWGSKLISDRNTLVGRHR